jgi:hypothetical protein
MELSQNLIDTLRLEIRFWIGKENVDIICICLIENIDSNLRQLCDFLTEKFSFTYLKIWKFRNY